MTLPVTKGEVLWGGFVVLVLAFGQGYALDCAKQGKAWAIKLTDTVFGTLATIIVWCFCIGAALLALWGVVALIKFFWTHS